MQIHGIKVHPAAATELSEAIDWYEKQSSNLGRELYEEVLVQIRDLARGDTAGSPYDDQTRYVRTKRFPYSIVFADRSEGRVIVAIAHAHRRPLYWRDRLES